MEFSRQYTEEGAAPESATSSSTMNCSNAVEETAADMFEAQKGQHSQPMRIVLPVHNDSEVTGVESSQCDASQPMPKPISGAAEFDDTQKSVGTSEVEQRVEQSTSDVEPAEDVQGTTTGPRVEHPSVEQRRFKRVETEQEQFEQQHGTGPEQMEQTTHTEPPMPLKPQQNSAPINNVDMMDAPDLDVEEMCQGPEQLAYRYVYTPPTLAPQLPASGHVHMNLPQECTVVYPNQQEPIIYQESAQTLQQCAPISPARDLTICQPIMSRPVPSIESSCTIVTPTGQPATEEVLDTDATATQVPDNVPSAPRADEAIVAALKGVVQSYEDNVVGTRLTDLGEYTDAFWEASDLISDLSGIEDSISSGAITTHEQLEEKLGEHLKEIEKVEADHHAKEADDARKGEEAYNEFLRVHPWYAEIQRVYEDYGKEFGERIDKAGERESYEAIRVPLVSQQIQKPDDMRAILEKHWQRVLNHETPAKEAANPVIQEQPVVVEDDVNSKWSDYFAEILEKRSLAPKGRPIKRCWHEYNWNLVLDDFYEPEAEFHMDIGKDKAHYVDLDAVQPEGDAAKAIRDFVDGKGMD